jgi:hypothetical protein
MGDFWIAESFDHVIRYEAELEEKFAYVRQNPIKKGLVSRPQDYKWLIVRANTPKDTGESSPVTETLVCVFKGS